MSLILAYLPSDRWLLLLHSVKFDSSLDMMSLLASDGYGSSCACVCADSKCATMCRLKLAENAGGSAESTNQDDHQPKATSHQPQQQAFGTPPRYPSPTPVSIASPAHPSTAAPQACFASQGQAQQPLHIPASVQASSEGTLPQNEADNLSESASLARPTLNSVQLVLKVFESSSSVQATLLPVAEDVRLTKQQSSEGVGEVSQQSVGGAAATGPLGDVSAGPSHHQVIEDQSTESGSVASTGGQAPLGSEEGMPSLEEVQRLLTDEKRKTAALLGKTLTG